MTRSDLIHQLMNNELEDHKNLTRAQARAVVNEVFDAVADGLKAGEVVRLPIGNLAVYEHEPEPRRGWHLGRVRVTYRKRNYVEFSTEREGSRNSRRSINSGAAQASGTESQGKLATKLQVSRRRKLVRAGAKAGKSQRLLAEELGVSATTVARDLDALGIKVNKKPAFTRRKRAAVWKPKSPRLSAKQRAENQRWKPPRQLIPSKIVRDSRKIPRLNTFKPNPIPKGQRQEHIQEMVQLMESWLAEQSRYYWRAKNILDTARRKLLERQDSYFRSLPKPQMSAAQLRDQTRPAEMDTADSQNLMRREEICSVWLFRWVAAWEPEDDKLRLELLDCAGKARP